MLPLVLILLLAFVALTFICTGVARFGQMYVYEQLPDGLAWRGLAAGALMAGALAVWALIEFKWPGYAEPPFTVTLSDVRDFDQFRSERLTAEGPKEVVYNKRLTASGQVQYVNADGRPWRRSESGLFTAIIVDENGERRRFVAQLGPNGEVPPGVMRYVEDGGKGRVMTEETIGQIATSRPGVLASSIGFHVVLIMLWFVAFWPILQFNSNHAVVLTLIAWLATAVLIWPLVKPYVAEARIAAATKEMTVNPP